MQYSILVVLDQVGEASQRELCDKVDLDRSTVADLVRRMEKHGLIERRRDPADARRNTVTLTSHGRDERMRLRPLVHEADRELTSVLSDSERQALRHGLRVLLTGSRPTD